MKNLFGTFSNLNDETDLQILSGPNISEVESPHNGYGACKSCHCKGWIPNNPKNDYCRNCNHHWTQHW